MLRFMCDTTPTDTLEVYVSDEERDEKVLAMIMENKLGQKISVLLTRDAAILLQNQLNDFIINGHR